MLKKMKIEQLLNLEISMIPNHILNILANFVVSGMFIFRKKNLLSRIDFSVKLKWRSSPIGKNFKISKNFTIVTVVNQDFSTYSHGIALCDVLMKPNTGTYQATFRLTGADNSNFSGNVGVGLEEKLKCFSDGN